MKYFKAIDGDGQITAIGTSPESIADASIEISHSEYIAILEEIIANNPPVYDDEPIPDGEDIERGY